MDIRYEPGPILQIHPIYGLQTENTCERTLKMALLLFVVWGGRANVITVNPF